MSIARLQASLAQATNEVTVAAANINFDFCLIKYEAPKEYQPIGRLLSTRRREDAEHGKSHVTARRLAALFDGICPDTPKLIKAYGERVSEISRQATDQESRDYSNSVFGAYTGVDATSIWAAATSSRSEKSGAIHVHLLACILAQLFGAAEATSIWVELVKERRTAIATTLEQDESVPFPTAAAAGQQEIARSQLAEWDSSARAWLQTADSIMRSKQTQLRLILKNVNLSIGSDSTVYPGVLSTWTKALKTMECLVSGVPQEVQDGSAILGLASWHIYPDINVFGSRNVEVLMNDPLVASGGILSLGCSPAPSTPISGVSWSLSLAQLKHYGQPIRKRGSFQPDPARITFKELLLVTLGCVLSRWGVSTGNAETLEAIKIIGLLSRNCADVSLAENGNEESDFTAAEASLSRMKGLQLLSSASQEYAADEDASQRLILLGRNRPQWIPSLARVGSAALASRPFFGLENVTMLLKCFRNPDGRVKFLRRMAARAAGLDGLTCVIQYTEQAAWDENTTFNYATVFPHGPPDAEDGRERPAKMSASTASHYRWVHTELMGMNVVGEAVIENPGYSTYGPHSFRRLTCIHTPQAGTDYELDYWYGDSELAAIYVGRNRQRPLPPTPKVTRHDLLWCLGHDLLSLDSILPDATDAVTQTLDCLAVANGKAFQTVPGPVIQVSILDKPLIQADCMREIQQNLPDASHRGVSIFGQTISILAYLVAGYDIPHSRIPRNIVGMSIGDSVFVPEKLLCDPIIPGKSSTFTRILGNLGKPGFVMFFSVEDPEVSPHDPKFWRIANPQKFDGTATDLFRGTSMHLLFTNWERPLEGFSSRGNQDVQITLMECVISIRERGRWIGDVDVIPALRSPNIYQLPPQEACGHSKPEAPGPHMISIESWDELRECSAGNVVVRANGNWIARLAATAYLAQSAEKPNSNIRRITLCPQSVCWRCMQGEIERYSANVYIY